jgi:hypothetical protein
LLDELRDIMDTFENAIAARLGLKPESLSRAFAKLRSVGVAVHAAHVAVSDVAKLRRLARDARSAIRERFVTRDNACLISE